MDSIIDLLEDSNIDEEDRPELLKELLSSLLIAPNSVSIFSFSLSILSSLTSSIK